MNPVKNPLNTAEWRIKPIPFEDSFAMMKMNWGAILGAFLFIGGLVSGLKIWPLLAISISIFGLVLGLTSMLYQARIARRHWEKVSAQCTDREWKQVLGAVGQRGGARLTWTFQLLCDFELHGKRYTVTPGYWSTFISEARLRKFLSKVISAEGTCQLWVNPNNPLQAEIFADDIRDFLLH